MPLETYKQVVFEIQVSSVTPDETWTPYRNIKEKPTLNLASKYAEKVVKGGKGQDRVRVVRVEKTCTVMETHL